MPTFILRGLDPEFWKRVQAKAKAEGTTVKATILHLLTKWLGVLPFVLLAFASVACSGPYESPGLHPTPIADAVPQVAPAPVLPPFSVTLTPAVTTISGVAYPGTWTAVIRVTATPGVVSPEIPVSVRLTCNGRTTTRDTGFGTLQMMACDFPQPGTYSVQATAIGAAGFQATAGLSVSVVYPPVEILEVFFSVSESSSDWTDVSFGTRRVDGATRYLWDFGDDSHEVAERQTMLPRTRHRFSRVERGESNERRVTVTATAQDGRTLATGFVIGKW